MINITHPKTRVLYFVLLFFCYPLLTNAEIHNFAGIGMIDGYPGIKINGFSDKFGVELAYGKYEPNPETFRDVLELNILKRWRLASASISYYGLGYTRHQASEDPWKDTQNGIAMFLGVQKYVGLLGFGAKLGYTFVDDFSFVTTGEDPTFNLNALPNREIDPIYLHLTFDVKFM